MPWTPEEREEWWRRFRAKRAEVNRRMDKLAEPRFAHQWSRWQAEEQEWEEQQRDELEEPTE